MSLVNQLEDLNKIKQSLMDALNIKQSRKYISKKRLLKIFLKSKRDPKPYRLNEQQPQKLTLKKKIQQIKAYNKRKQVTKEKNIVEEDQQRLIECPICMDFLVNPVQTQCGHTFCEICLTEALLKQNICAMCKKVIPNFNFAIDELLDGLVKQYVEGNSVENKEKYIIRRKKYMLWNRKRRPQEFKEEMKIDLRDLDNIWCEAVINKIERRQNNELFLFIHYVGWNSIYDEMIPSTSNRIASSGFFTKRSDIPQYRLNNNINGNNEQLNGAMQGVVLLGGEGQANLEGNVEIDDDDEDIQEINEEEFQKQQQRSSQINTNSSQQNNNNNINLNAVKLFESIFKVSIQNMQQKDQQ